MKAIVFGAAGLLGSELSAQLKAGGHQVFAFDAEKDVTDPSVVNETVSQIKPEVIFNCAAYNAVDQAEHHPAEAMKLNADAVKNVAEAALAAGAVVVHFSTGFIFDGKSETGYNEQAGPHPLSVYAGTKYKGEQELQKSRAKYYLVRLNLLFGRPAQSAAAKKSFPDQILELAKTKNEFDFVFDEVSTPTYAPDLAAACIKLVQNNFPLGIYHLINDGQASWYEWAKFIFDSKGIKPVIHKVSAESFKRDALRPKNSVLINTKFPKFRSWQQATAEFLKEYDRPST